MGDMTRARRSEQEEVHVVVQRGDGWARVTLVGERRDPGSGPALVQPPSRDGLAGRVKAGHPRSPAELR